MYNRALAVVRRHWIRAHSTLDTVNNLGNSTKIKPSQRCGDDVQPRAGRFEKALGSEHTSTLETVSNLVASTPIRPSQDAEMMCNRALAGFEKALDPSTRPRS